MPGDLPQSPRGITQKDGSRTRRHKRGLLPAAFKKRPVGIGSSQTRSCSPTHNRSEADILALIGNRHGQTRPGHNFTAAGLVLFRKRKTGPGQPLPRYKAQKIALVLGGVMRRSQQGRMRPTHAMPPFRAAATVVNGGNAGIVPRCRRVQSFRQKGRHCVFRRGCQPRIVPGSQRLRARPMAASNKAPNFMARLR